MLGPGSASALEKVHAAKAVAVAWTSIPLNVGVEEKIFERYGLDVEVTDFTGDQKMQQGKAAGSIDFGLGGGPAMAFVAKGGPNIAVASYAGSPLNIAIAVGNDGGINSVADLKGKILSSSPVGSLTAWLIQRASIDQGWGPNGIKIAELGGFQPCIAALRTHQIDGLMTSVEAGLSMEQRGIGHVLTSMGKYAPVCVTHVVFARRDLVAEKPDLVDRFLKGFFATIAFMKSHKAETAKVAIQIMQMMPEVADKTYDSEIGMLQDDGAFDPKALAVLNDSFLEMKLMTEKPPDEALFTTKFLPVKP